MKHGRHPTLKQRLIIASWKTPQGKPLNADNWQVVKDTPNTMTIVNINSHKTINIPKDEIDWRKVEALKKSPH